MHSGIDDLGTLAQRLGRYMAEQRSDGLPGHFGDGLLDAFADEDPDAIRMALYELRGEGLVDLSTLINCRLPRVRTTVNLFVACDPAITGQNPVDDSIVLARMLLDDRNLGGNARNLEAATGWERRRFNPAFALIVPCIGPGRVRDADQSDYPVMGVLVGDEDVVTLRRYIRGEL